jgi:hypothetical protein
MIADDDEKVRYSYAGYAYAPPPYAATGMVPKSVEAARQVSLVGDIP